MKRMRSRCVAAAALALGFPLASPAHAQQGTRLDCERLARILTGRAGPTGDVCKVTLARGDLEVVLLGAKLPLSINRSSWAAFTPTGPAETMVMGDLVLRPSELPAAMRGLREAGILVTAVHGHMMGESPEVMYMHYHGMGEAAELARGVHDALARAGALGESPPPAPEVGPEGVTVAGVPCARIAEVLADGQGSVSAGGGWCKVSIELPARAASMGGQGLPASMGFNHWFGFAQTADGGEAVITGDFALTEEQVNPVVSALLERGIDIVRLHNHTMFEEPRIMFFHFQARGEPLALARGLRAGLEAAGSP